MKVSDVDLQGQFGHFDSEFLAIWLVRVITCNGFELESPNLHQICILGICQTVLKVGVIDIGLQGHLAIISTQETSFNVALLYWSGQGVSHFPKVLLWNSYRRYMLWPIPVKTLWGECHARPHWCLVDIASSDAFVPSGNKPLTEPMSTKFYVTIWWYKSPMS